MAEFVVNKKIHLATKMFSFMTNYNKELRIETDIRKKEKVEKVMEFTERMKRIQEETLRKVQEEMKI